MRLAQLLACLMASSESTALVEYQVNTIAPLEHLYAKEKAFHFKEQDVTITLRQDWGSAGTGAATW